VVSEGLIVIRSGVVVGSVGVDSLVPGSGVAVGSVVVGSVVVWGVTGLEILDKPVDPRSNPLYEVHLL
jgi:hypothetical protein